LNARTFASALLIGDGTRPGVNPWYVARQPGHVDVMMVFQPYGKFISSDYQRPRLQFVKAA
jgi:integrase